MISPRRFSGTCLLLGGALLFATLPAASGHRKRKVPPDVAEVLARMDERAKQLKTVSANLEHTKVTVLVNDKSTEEGQFFFRKSKNPEIRIEFQKPDPKVILVKKNKAELYLPKINQIQEYDLEQKSDLVQQFLLLGFGSDSGDLRKSYNLKLLKEEDLEGDTMVVLELIPRKEAFAAQVAKIQLWISEESWLPVQQELFEPSGDYLIARYSSIKVNRDIPASTFELHPSPGAKRVKMN